MLNYLFLLHSFPKIEKTRARVTYVVIINTIIVTLVVRAVEHLGNSNGTIPRVQALMGGC